MSYERPKIEITEVVIDVIAYSGPPAIIPNPTVEDVDFDCNSSVWDEMSESYWDL